MEEKTLFEATVSLPVKNNQVLLGLKMRKIGAGCINGYGGGVEPGETIRDAAIRELEEESGKKSGKEYISTFPELLEKVAIVDFHNTKSDGETYICRVHFFIIKKWFGKANETDEMTNPKFYDISNLPLEMMMPADKEFMPLIFKGKKLLVTAKYGPFQKQLLEKVKIQEVEFFPQD